MFEKAQNLVITGGQFLATNASERDWKTEGHQVLRDKIAPGAFHNSRERYNPPKCYPNTRKAVLDRIMAWVKDVHKLTLFMWIYGPAGTGKSAIVQSIAEICTKTGGILAASFFFCRTSPGRNEETLFITTIVYQLMISIPEIAPSVGKALIQDPLLLSRSLEAQVKALVVDPLNEAAMHEIDGPLLAGRPNLIIVDGLDECSESKSQRYLLETLLSAVEELSVPILFLISSRPEPRIRDTFNDPTWNALSIRIALDDSYQPEADIRLYLESRFEEIRRKHPSLPPSWPSRPQIHALIQNSSGQFIYVSTVMKYLDSDSSSMPQDRLNHVLGLTMCHGEGAPFSEIDAIYHHILSGVSDIDRAMDILTFILMVDFWSKTESLIEAFFGYRRGEMDLIINDLHSLIKVPHTGDPDQELRVTHASTFSDFLFDRSRSGKFFINPRVAHGRLSGQCLIHLKNRYSPLMQDPADIHHLRSLLMVNCVESDFSAQVMVDLYEFDISSHLGFWNSEDNIVGMYEHDSKRIINMITWLKTHDQRHPRYPTDLFLHHRPAIDEWIINQLDNYPRTINFDEFLAAGTLTNFMSEEMLVLLGIGLKQKGTYTKDRQVDPLQIYACDREFMDFYSIFTEFLASERRAKHYFVHSRSFVNLAVVILEYLTTDDLDYLEPQRKMLGILPNLLSLCSQSTVLFQVLSAHRLAEPCKPHELFYIQRLVVYESVRRYIAQFQSSSRVE